MPQDSGQEPKSDKVIAAAAARILEEVKAEPVPEPILDLARKLDAALAEKRRKAAAADKD